MHRVKWLKASFYETRDTKYSSRSLFSINMSQLRMLIAKSGSRNGNIWHGYRDTKYILYKRARGISRMLPAPKVRQERRGPGRCL